MDINFGGAPFHCLTWSTFGGGRTQSVWGWRWHWADMSTDPSALAVVLGYWLQSEVSERIVDICRVVYP